MKLVLRCSIASIALCTFSSSLVESKRQGKKKSSSSSTFEVPHGNRFDVVDHQDEDLPKIEYGGRVLELVNGEHYDDLLQDTPDELRPPSVIAFYGHKSCPMSKLADLEFKHKAEFELPARERLFMAKYDVDAAPHRAWYKFTPERDLATRFNVSLPQRCPDIAFVPRSCDGWTEWCHKGDGVLGCEDFKESCKGVQHWDGTGSWSEWLTDLIDKEGEPQISPFYANYYRQGRWMRARDEISTLNVLRNMYLGKKLPALTPTGAKTIECPKEILDWLRNLHEKMNTKNRKKLEHWEATGTQNSFHTTKTYLYDLDSEYRKKMDFANKYFKPILEEWSGIPDLELTSFYGIREYFPGHWLRKHVDREDTHVISVTITVDKLPINDTDDVHKGTYDEIKDPWPLMGTNWDGDDVLYEHGPGKAVLYESAKFVHGRHMRNPVGTHLGAFLHYRPPQGWGQWTDVSKKANAYMEQHRVRVLYKTTATVEPENPVYTEKVYGEGSHWDVDGVLGETEDNNNVKSIWINRSETPTRLVWLGPNGNEVDQCGVMFKGKECSVDTYVKHGFAWRTRDGGAFNRKIRATHTIQMNHKNSDEQVFEWWGEQQGHRERMPEHNEL